MSYRGTSDYDDATRRSQRVADHLAGWLEQDRVDCDRLGHPHHGQDYEGHRCYCGAVTGEVVEAVAAGLRAAGGGGYEHLLGPEWGAFPCVCTIFEEEG